MSLTHRAEQALLGALVDGPAQLAEVPGLQAADFADARHQAVFAVLSQIHAETPHTRGDELAELITSRAMDPGIDLEYVTRLRQSHPDGHNAAVYGRMVHEAALRRALAGHAERLNQSVTADPGADRDQRDHMLRLSAALEAHGRNFDTWPGGDNSTPGADPGTAGHREEQVLADLFQHPETIRETAAWLDPELFTAPGRRIVYEALIAVDGYGDPVTELTVSWEVARRVALDRTLNTSGDIGTANDQEPGPAYLTRLGETTVQAGSAALIGRDLLAEQTRTELAAGTGGLAGTVSADHAEPDRTARAGIASGLTQEPQPGMLQRPEQDDPGRERHLNTDR